MPPVQRTFSLIPPKGSNIVIKPPMTSKAAKKAYLKANRAPRVSRAEQRRLDNEELERQKKEYEKERNAAKAKAVREKKVAKLADEKEARRKMGLPEPSRFVRASQPTIAKFVKAGSKRKWEEIHDVKEESEDTMGEDSVDPKVRQHLKTTAVELESEDEFGEFPSLSQTDILAKIDSSMLSASVEEVVSKPEQEGGNTSDPDYGDFPSLSQSHILEKANMLPESVKQQKPTSTPDRPIQECSKGSPHQEMSPNLPKHKPTALGNDDDLVDDSQALADLVTTQVLSEAAEAEAKSSPVIYRRTSPGLIENSPVQSVRVDNSVAQKAAVTPLPRKDVFSKCVANEPQTRSGPDRHPASIKPSLPYATLTNNLLEEVSINMPPPTLPIKKASAISFTPSSNIVRPAPKMEPVKRFAMPAKEMAPPSATQVFIEDHLDYFFPSPSQQIQELLDHAEDFPSNTQVALDLSPKKPSVEDITEFQDFFSTQDLVISSQDLSELTTPNRPPVSRPNNWKGLTLLAQISRDTEKPSYPSENCATQIIKSRLMESNSSFPRKKAPLTPRTETPQPQPSHTWPSSTNEAFKKDLSLSLSNPRCHQVQGMKTLNLTPPPVPPKIPLPRPPKRRFFEEKEEDLFHAAIEESKMIAATAQHKQDSQLSRGRAVGVFSNCAALNAPGRQIQRVPGDRSKDLTPIISWGMHDSQRILQTIFKNNVNKKEGGRSSSGPKCRDAKFGQTRTNTGVHTNRPAASSKTLTVAATRSKRTLTRSESTISDYGDDELIGCSQELLALC